MRYVETGKLELYAKTEKKKKASLNFKWNDELWESSSTESVFERLNVLWYKNSDFEMKWGYYNSICYNFYDHIYQEKLLLCIFSTINES